jgi:uncharacterized protein (DUF983 family)
MSCDRCGNKISVEDATGTKNGRTLLTPVGVIIFGLFVTLFVGTALAFDKWLGLPKIITMPINFYVATQFSFWELSLRVGLSFIF